MLQEKSDLAASIDEISRSVIGSRMTLGQGNGLGEPRAFQLFTTVFGSPAGIWWGSRGPLLPWGAYKEAALGPAWPIQMQPRALTVFTASRRVNFAIGDQIKDDIGPRHWAGTNAAESFYWVFFLIYSHAAIYARASSVPGSKFSRSITSRHQWEIQAKGSRRLMSSPTTA